MEELLKKAINKGETEKKMKSNPTTTREHEDTNDETADNEIMYEPEVTSVWANMVAKKRVVT